MLYLQYVFYVFEAVGDVVVAAFRKGVAF